MKNLFLFLLLFAFIVSSNAQGVFDVKKHRLFGTVETGLFGGIGKIDIVGLSNENKLDNDNQRFQIRTMIGYFVTDRISLGFGTIVSSNEPVLPLTGELRYSLFKKANSPFACFSYGKAIGEVQKGHYIEAGGGYRMKLGQKKFITFRAAYNTILQKDAAVIFDSGNELNSTVYDVRYQNLSFTVGLMF